MSRLHELCRDGKLAEVRSSLARGEYINHKDSTGSSALMAAVIKNHNSIVKLLLDQPGVDVNVRNVLGRTALHCAAWSNNAEGARMLLLHHRDFDSAIISANVMDNEGDTALMYALRFRHEEVLRELIKHQCVSLDVGRFEMYQG